VENALWYLQMSIKQYFLIKKSQENMHACKVVCIDQYEANNKIKFGYTHLSLVASAFCLTSCILSLSLTKLTRL
jgi:hypothetical protein